MHGRGGDVGGDEAAWLDLIARYDLSAEVDPAHAPWPDAENLLSAPGTTAPPGSDTAADGDPRAADGRATVLGAPDGASAHDPAARDSAATGMAGPGTAGTETAGASTGGTDTAPGSSAPSDTVATEKAAADPAPGQTGAVGNGTRPRVPGSRPVAGAANSQPPGAHRARVVRAASQPRPPAAGDADADDRYIPPPPPPLPNLDPVAKGAWAALCGGPAYLLLATLLGWQVSGLGALLAVTAFVAGFAIVVLRMGDGPSRGDGPDNGAVLLCSEPRSASPGQVSGTDKPGIAA